MKAARTATAAVTGIAIACASLSGCNLLALPHLPARSEVRPPAVRPSVLALILATGSASADADLQSAVAATARPGEHLIVISAVTGATIGSSTAPGVAAIAGPAFPSVPSSDATAFQKAAYNRSVRKAQSLLRNDRALLVQLQRRELSAWAGRSVAAALSAAGQHASGRPGLAAAITEANAEVAGLQQTGLAFGTRKVIAIVGAGDSTPPPVYASLSGTSAVITGVADADADTAWQADLLQAGASRVFVLSPFDAGQFGQVLTHGLDGPPIIDFRLARIDYGPAQYALPRTALPSLDQLLGLLTVKYPGASATITGYTDNIAVRGGNQALSWKRARAVLDWLVGHGVQAERLQAVGLGAADPAAPNRPGGQPLNRRVVVIIAPAGNAR